MSLTKSILDHPLLSQWIVCDPGGRIRLQTGKVELGQGIVTALLQMACEELDASPDQVDLVSGDTRQGPNEWYTAGSLSIEVGGLSLRQVCAQARGLLCETAARDWGCDANTLTTRHGQVHGPQGQTVSYGVLAARVDWHQPVSEHWPLKGREHWQWIGRSVPRVDLVGKMQGGAFIHDITLPGMWHARVLRPAGWNWTLVDPPMDRLTALSGVAQVFRSGNLLALLGPREAEVHAASEKARPWLTWTEQPGLSMPQGASAFMQQSVVHTEAVQTAPSGTSRLTVAATLEADYSKPFIAHAAIGPSCALAHRQGDSLTVWTHSQGVFQLRTQIARGLRVAESAVQVIHRPGSGCYGHNGADDAAFDAALLAWSVPERPIRVLWRREDELGVSPVGSAMHVRLRATLGADQRIAQWALEVWSGRHGMRPGLGEGVNLLGAWQMENPHPMQGPADLPMAMGGGGHRNAVALYAFEQDVQYHFVPDMPLRTSSLRTLGAFGNTFAIESFMDELAQAAAADPVQFRLNHLQDPRAVAVLERVAQMSGWTARGDRCLGVALGRYKNKAAYVAVVAEVVVADDLRVQRLWAAVDAGLVVNPDGLRNQIEGGLIQALSWTLKEQVQCRDGVITSCDWEQYPILTFSDVPDEIEVEMIDRPDAPPLGAGEAAAGPLAAAVGNAVAVALGTRMRHLPLSRDQVMQALLDH
jgi:nicotinate dehydrogenase subunit B